MRNHSVVPFISVLPGSRTGVIEDCTFKHVSGLPEPWLKGEFHKIPLRGVNIVVCPDSKSVPKSFTYK